MVRLKATLVATIRLRPWRTGWSVARGVHFSLPKADRPVLAEPARQGDQVPAERPCFIDEDGTVLPDTVLPDTALAWTAAPSPAPEVVREPWSREGAGSSGVRAWWSLASKPSGR